jgi:hypothetical protein
MKSKRTSLIRAMGAVTIAVVAMNRVSAASVTVATVPAGLTVTVDGADYTAPVTFDWASASLHTLATPSPQVASDGHSRSSFSAWSDGGGQSHSVTAPDSGTNITATFSTQYLLETSVNPAGSGTITNNPQGPWYDGGQIVSLSATTNTGYRIYFWQGADTVTGNTAQVTMNGYHLVSASFIPADYPYIVVTNRGGAVPGDLIGSLGGRTADKTSLYYVVLDNTGTNALSASKTSTLARFVTPQGFDAVPGGGVFSLKDETFKTVDSFTTLGYTLDTHDMKLLPNGHALLFGQEVRTIDMSQLVPGGKTAASVTGDILQEIDANKHLVFEWHTFDHIPITNSFYDLTQQTIDYAHMNAASIDPTDNNLLVSLRTTSEIVKINRQTGDVMWRLGGKANQFTFVGEHEENAPYYTVGQHDIHRLPNGHLLYFDNGNISGGGITPSDRTYSRGVEYRLDETNKVATLVWEFRHTPDISAPCTGSVRRFANGNTLIDWGCAVATSGTIVTEVSPIGDVVFEMSHAVKGPSSSFGKAVWNSPDLIRSSTLTNVELGQTYEAPEAGASLTVTELTNSAGNTLVIERHLDAVRFPQFSGKAPQVVMEHLVLTGSDLGSLQARLALDLPDTRNAFDTPIIQDPAQLLVYQRPTPGQGQFSPVPTTYDSEVQRLRITTTQLGEFIFAYPDMAETPFVPVILKPGDQSQVSQAEPITLTWVPQGMVGSFDLQLATNSDFSNLVVDTNNLGSGSYVLQNPLPNTQYFWRVRVVNEGGTSEWASASFTTVPSVLHLTYPAGGEVWQRFQVVTIRWQGNISANVALDIYKGGVSNRNFVASTPDTGAYTWTVGQFAAFPTGSDYTLKIRSTANPALYDVSPPFSIITNVTNLRIDAASLTNLPDGSLQFGFSVPGALGATMMGSTNLLNWDILQMVPLTNGSAVFTDTTATNFPQRFYRLRVP